MAGAHDRTDYGLFRFGKGPNSTTIGDVNRKNKSVIMTNFTTILLKIRFILSPKRFCNH